MSENNSKWTDKEIQKLKELYAKQLTVNEMSEILGKTKAAVRNKAYKLGITHTETRWTEEEVNYLKENYKSYNLREISQMLKRDSSNVCRKAKQLGIELTHKKKEITKPVFTEEEKHEHRSQAMKKYLETHPEAKKICTERLARIMRESHPRGMLGKKHTEEARQKFSERSKRMWANEKSYQNSDEYRQSLSDKAMEQHKKGSFGQGYSRAKGGKRKDLNNMYFRSAWEANYARYLNILIKKSKIHKWEYEPDTFEFVNIKRGTRSYMPDFKIWETPSSTPYYVEIKGWMDDKSKTKMKRMAKYYPEIRVDLFMKKEYAALKKQYSNKIENWEN